jgi:hypothetical protein
VAAGTPPAGGAVAGGPPLAGGPGGPPVAGGPPSAKAPEEKSEKSPISKPAADGKQTPGDAKAEAEKDKGPKVDLTIVDIKAPYPEYDSRGNYTITLEVEGRELTDFGVWEFIAFDVKGKEVGRIPQSMKMPFEHPKRLKFDSIYFLAKPDKFEVRLTDKKAVRAAKSNSGAGTPGIGAGGGGAAGGGSGDSGGQRPGLGAGGGPPSGGGDGGGEDKADEG